MKSRILQLLRAADGFLSGADLSRRLGVTRAAVWKVIKSLQQEGYPIEAVTNRGYRLSGLPDVLSETEITAALTAADLHHFIREVHYAESADSTNRLARHAAETGAPEASLFVTERQTTGRGRRGRTWLSDHRQGLWFSLLLRPQAGPAELARITLLAGLAVAEALQDCCQADIGLKWPNDLVSARNGRKLGGILTEMVIEENVVNSIIIGIGLNIQSREFPPELAQTATSLTLETGRTFRRVDVLAAVLASFARRYAEFLVHDRWLADYRRLCLTLNREVRVLFADGSSLEGTAIDLDGAGELIVAGLDGRRQTVRSGEVSVRGLAPF